MFFFIKKGITPLYALFFIVCGFFLCSAFFGDNHSYETNENYGFRTAQCLEGNFYATSGSGGLGNVLFELLAFIGFAEVSGRLPIIREENSLKRIEQLRNNFPAMHAYFEKSGVDKERCIFATRSLKTVEKCCVYDDATIESIRNATEATVHVRVFYTQGIKYIRNIPETFLQSLLNASGSVRNEVKNLFPADVLESNNQKICMHIRLGDFQTSELVYPSFEKFSIASARYVQESVLKGNSTLLVFSNEVETSSKWFQSFQNVHHAQFNKKRPANTEWEFSRQYCDVMIITASASTYGWWMGFLSKGQRVYFNKDFSKPNGIEKELNPTDFFPPAWIPLKLDGNTVKEAPFSRN